MFQPTQMLIYCRKQSFQQWYLGAKSRKRKTDETMEVTRKKASVTNQIIPNHYLENFGHNQQIDIFWTYNAQLRVYGKRFNIRTDRRQWKIWKRVYKMISRNMRTHYDELVQHLNCHAKQSEIERSDLKDHDI